MQNELSKGKHVGKNLGLLIISILLIIMGGYVLMNPETAVLATAMYVGISFIAIGIGYLMESKHRHSYLYGIAGIVDILLGVLLLAHLTITALSIPFILGIWCLLTGVIYLVSGLQMDDDMLSMGRLTVMAGVLGILFGVLVLLHPLLGILTVSLLLGSYFIICGLFELARYCKG